MVKKASSWLSRKWFGLACLTVIAVLLGLSVQVVDQGSANQIGIGVGVGEKVITLGSSVVCAAGSVDYTYDGVDDDVQWQAAIDALPATGGRLVNVSAVQLNFSATVTRAIDNVTIEGSGRGTYFTNDAATDLFTAGGNNWKFVDLRTDAGDIGMGATTGWMWTNVTINATYYAYRSPYGQSAMNDVTVASLTDSGLTSGRVTVAGAGGLLGDDGGFLYNTATDVVTAEIGRTATFTVAASNASVKSIAQADYICDGTADDVQINAAIQALPAGGGSVVLSEGTFTLAAPINVDQKMMLAGQGPHSTSITLANGVNDNVIETTGSPWDVIFRDFNIYGNKANQAAGHGLYLNDAANVFIARVHIGSCKQHGLYRTGASPNTRIYGCHLGSNDGNGYYCDSGSGGAWLDSIYSLSNGGFAATIMVGADYWIVNSSFDQSDIGLNIGNIGNSHISNCYFGANSNQGLYITGTVNYLSMIGNIFYNNTAAASAGAQIQGTISHSTFIGNIATGNTFYGFNWAATFVNCVIQGNIARNNSGAYQQRLSGSFTDCVFTENIAPAGGDWLVTSTFTDTIVSGNTNYIAPGEIRTATGVLTAGVANAICFAWNNPTNQDILIKKVVIETTTAGGTGGSHLDVGIADDAAGTNRGVEFFDDLLLNTTIIHDSWAAGDGGTQTKWVLCQDSASVIDDWVVGQILDANAGALVGTWYIEYVGR